MAKNKKPWSAKKKKKSSKPGHGGVEAPVTPPTSQAPFAPTPGPSPSPTHLAADTVYEGDISNINRQEAERIAEINRKRIETQQEFGIDDLSNPFSRMAILQRTSEQRKAHTQNTAAARGQLYAGSTQTKVRSDRFKHDQADDALRRAFASAQADYAEAETRAKSGAVGARTDAEGRRVTTQAGAEPLPGDPNAGKNPQNAWGTTGTNSKGQTFKRVAVNGMIVHVYPDGRRVHTNKPALYGWS